MQTSPLPLGYGAKKRCSLIGERISEYIKSGFFCLVYTDKSVYNTEMFEMEPRIERMEKGDDAYFSLYWSKLTRADKYTVTTSVPSVSGLYELYYEDSEKKLNLLTINTAWLGGLRSQIRQDIEPDLKKPENLRIVLENLPVYYRFSISAISEDIQDVVWFLNQTYFGDTSKVHDSGRYKKVFVKELAPDKIHWV